MATTNNDNNNDVNQTLYLLTNGSLLTSKSTIPVTDNQGIFYKTKDGQNVISSETMSQDNYKLFLLGLAVLGCWILVMLFCARKELFRRFVLKYFCCQPIVTDLPGESIGGGAGSGGLGCRNNFPSSGKPPISPMKKKQIGGGGNTNWIMKTNEVFSPPSAIPGQRSTIPSGSIRRNTSLKRRESIQSSAIQARAEYRRASQLSQMTFLDPPGNHQLNIVEQGNLVNSLSGTSEPVLILKDGDGDLLLCSASHQILPQIVASSAITEESSDDDGSGGNHNDPSKRRRPIRRRQYSKSMRDTGGSRDNSGKLRRTKARAREESKLARNASLNIGQQGRRLTTAYGGGGGGIQRQQNAALFESRRSLSSFHRHNCPPTAQPSMMQCDLPNRLFRHASHLGSTTTTGHAPSFSTTTTGGGSGPHSNNSSFRTKLSKQKLQEQELKVKSPTIGQISSAALLPETPAIPTPTTNAVFSNDAMSPLSIEQ